MLQIEKKYISIILIVGILVGWTGHGYAKKKIKKVTIEKIPYISLHDNKDFKPSIQLVLHGCDFSKNIYNKIASGIGVMMRFYMKTAGYRYPDDFCIKIRIFDNAYMFRKYQKKVSSSRSCTGFYSTQEQESVLLKRDDTNDMIGLVYHEVNHALLHYRVDNPPRWISEGLSEYFENMIVRKNRYYVHPQLERDQRCKNWVRWGSLKDLISYLSMSNETWDDENKPKYYPSRTIAWSLVYYLMSQHEGKMLISRILRELNASQNVKEVSAKVLNKYYTGGVYQFEQNWHDWIKKPRRGQHCFITIK